MRLATLTAVGVLTLASTAWASDVPIWQRTVGLWTVSLEDMGWFNCRIRTSLSNPDRRVDILMSATGPIIALQSEEIRVSRLSDQQIILKFDLFEYRGTLGRGTDFNGLFPEYINTQILISGEDIRVYFNRFAQAQTASISFENGARWDLPMRGSNAAKAVLDRCDAEARSRNLRRLAVDPTIRAR